MFYAGANGALNIPHQAVLIGRNHYSFHNCDSRLVYQVWALFWSK